MESPPPNRLISCGGGAETTPRQRRYSRRVEAKSSPKTPIHPSNGYQVMEGVDYQPPSARMSPTGIKVGRKDVATAEAENGGGRASCFIDKHDARDDASPDAKPTSDAPRSIHRPASRGDDPPVVAVAVSQESETDATDSLGDSSVASRPRESRGPGQTRVSAGGSARRRSLRLRSKAIEPAAPSSPKPGGGAGGGNPRERGSADGPSAADGGDDDDDDDVAPNPAAPRRSPRKRGKSLGGSSAPPGNVLPSVAAAKKSPSKRKRRPSAGTVAQNDVEGLSPAKRGCEEMEVALYSKHELDVDQRMSPKKLVLEAAPAYPAKDKENMDFVWGEEGVDSTDKDVEIVLELQNPIFDAKAGPTDAFAISMSEDGRATLVEALEKIAFGVVIGPSNFANVSRRGSSGRRHKNKKRGRLSRKSALESLDPMGAEEDVPCGFGMGRAKGRRDTFDLSKKRGLVSSAKRLEELNISIDRDASYEEGANPDYVTPKSGSAEVNINAFVGEISRTLDDEPQRDGLQKGKEGVAEGVEASSAVENNLRHLTSIAIEEGMRQLFPHKVTQVYKYPCVSARIFAAMGAVYEDQEDFAPLLPFFLSLVEAEIVSLKKADEEEHEPIFDRKVCFSGFDYSSTTTALGEVVGQGGGDLRPSIEALEAVLRQALKLSHPVHCLDVAVRCLRCIASCEGASDVCAKTMVGYFPSARFGKAFKHYIDEMEDVKRFLLSQGVRAGDRHVGVRYRLNDFVGRSVRYHMRELLNTLPEDVVGFDVEEVDERWGRAVDDRSISSILNFALERIHELARTYPEIFEYGARPLPDFFTSGASRDAPSWTLKVTKGINRATYEALAADILEARAFLFGARATKFAMELLLCPGVEEHIHSLGGWAAVEAIAGTFHDLKLHEGSENEHFVQLREVRDLIFMLEDVDQKIGQKVEDCESAVGRLRRKFVNFKSNRRSYLHNLKALLAAEKGEHFPVVVSMG